MSKVMLFAMLALTIVPTVLAQQSNVEWTVPDKIVTMYPVVESEAAEESQVQDFIRRMERRYDIKSIAIVQGSRYIGFRKDPKSGRMSIGTERTLVLYPRAVIMVVEKRVTKLMQR